MSDRTDEAFVAWREATEHVRAPPGLAADIARAIESPGLADSLSALTRPALLAGAVVAVALAVVAATSVRSFALDAADYALSRAP
jgi:hypothetical protein